MNSVSPTTAQYIGVVMQDELVENQRQQPMERQSSFGLRPPQTSDPSREAPGEPDEMDKLKAKLMSAWNNVKYGTCVSVTLIRLSFVLMPAFVNDCFQTLLCTVLYLTKSVIS